MELYSHEIFGVIDKIACVILPFTGTWSFDDLLVKDI